MVRLAALLFLLTLAGCGPLLSGLGSTLAGAWSRAAAVQDETP